MPFDKLRARMMSDEFSKQSVIANAVACPDGDRESNLLEELEMMNLITHMRIDCFVVPPRNDDKKSYPLPSALAFD